MYVSGKLRKTTAKAHITHQIDATGSIENSDQTTEPAEIKSQMTPR